MPGASCPVTLPISAEPSMGHMGHPEYVYHAVVFLVLLSISPLLRHSAFPIQRTPVPLLPLGPPGTLLAQQRHLTP